jgi:hypothetical protein
MKRPSTSLRAGLALVVALLLPLPAWASLSYIDSNSAQAASVAIGTHISGDIIVLFCHRDGSTTAPTLPGGYTSIANSGANTTSARIGYKIADGTETTTGTCANATSVAYEILRGQDTSPIGGNAAGGASSSSIAYNTVTMTRSDGTSWVLGFAGHRTATNVGQNPAGMSLRTSASDIAASDTNGGVSSWSTQSVTVNQTSGWRSYTVEILALPPPPTPCSGTCPTLVQDVTWGTNNGTENGNGFKYHLPNPTLANNLLICGVSWDTAATATITDNIGTNTWVSGPTSNDGTRRVALRYVLGVAAGTQDLTLTLSASAANVHFRCSEFYNVATSSAVDGTATSASNIFGPTIAAGSITTTTDNDLIYHYGIDDTALCCNNHVTGFVVGSGFNLLPSDRHLGHFAQYFAWGGHGAINPTMTVNQSSNDAFGSAAIAFKQASAGTAPGSGIRIVREYHTSIDATAYVVQWPCSGNLTVAVGGENAADHSWTSVTDSDSNTFTKITNPSPASSYPQMFYASSMTCSSPNTRTMTLNSAAGGATLVPVIYDIAGAAASPLGVVAGVNYATQSAAGGSSCPGAAGSDTDHAPDITPTAAPGLAIAALNNGTGPTCAMMGSGYVHDSAWYTGESDESTLMDSANGFAHVYYSSTSALDFGWHWANATATNGYALAVTFKAPATAGGVRKRVDSSQH